MRTAWLLVTLMALVAVAVGRPTETEDDLSPHPEAPDSLATLDHRQLEEGALVRERSRRSPKDDGRGSVTGGVRREPGVGTVVHAEGQGTVWKSKNGNAQVDAHGQWEKVVRGPQRGKPNYGAGIRFTGRF